MSPVEQTTNGVPPPAHEWKADVVFKMFADSVRRRIFLSLARLDQQTPTQLLAAAERNLDQTMKRLRLLRSDKFAQMKPDKVDKRRRFWSVTPAVPLISSEAGKALDFGFLKVPLTVSSDAGGTGADKKPWVPDMVYHSLGDPTRRNLLLKLAQTHGQIADQLKGNAFFADATLKHLRVLRAAGLVLMSANETDGRRHLYSVAPDLATRCDQNGTVLDFGFCEVRLS